MSDFKNKVRHIVEHFCIYGNYLWCDNYGTGHINDTFVAVFNQGGMRLRYIFQRINTEVFKDPDVLMDNIARVLAHSRKKLEGRRDASRRALTLIQTVDGKYYYRAKDGNCWRAYLFIENSKTYDILETAEQAYQAAKGFAVFQRNLADLRGARLAETIPNFHNTPSRLRDFDKALAEDAAGRAKSCQAEIQFVQDHRDIAPVLVDLLAKGELPERITHNDTKLNNVLLDDITNEGICVIDLDTVMPGLSLYDFGDLVRTAVCPAAEDETDLSKVCVRPEMFEALAKGFIEGYDGQLTDKEVELMPFSGALITFEIGLRFLTDHLSGDKYFKVHRANHNLDRSRNQFALVEKLLELQPALCEIVQKYSK